MRLPRTRLGLFRTVVIGAEVVLLVLAIGATGALGTLGSLRERVELANRPPESRGATIYQAQCAGCHGGSNGGQVSDVPPKHNANGHTWQHSDCDLLLAIRQGNSATLLRDHARTAPPPQASPMPAFVGRLEDDEIRDVIAYIRTLWTDEQRASQRQLTKERCAS
jgi:mono/diheme cytochrome c family protein